MAPDVADLSIRWTARLFVAFYVVRLCIDVSQPRNAQSMRWGRGAWSAGCALFVAHVFVSFQFLHAWSHEAALEHVRQRTVEMTGVSTALGLYVNYAFGLIWIADTALWWRRLDWPENRIVYWTIQGVFAFLMVQATMVFGPRFWIALGTLIIVLLLTVSRIRHWNSAEKVPSADQQG